jgi:DinB superfamily
MLNHARHGRMLPVRPQQIGHPMNSTTVRMLEAFPQHLEANYSAIPSGFEHWAPPSWEGVPSEPFTAIEQICHVRDTEIDGYQLRFRRTLDELNPMLASLDGEAIAKENCYDSSDSDAVFAAFRLARTKTVALITGLTSDQLNREAVLDGYGRLSLRSLVHYLCSHDQQHLAGLQWLLGKIEATRVAH